MASLYAFRRQGAQNRLNLPVSANEITAIHHEVDGILIRLSRQGEGWQLEHPAYGGTVEADARAVEALLEDLRHWEVAGLREAADFETPGVPQPVQDAATPGYRTAVTDGHLRLYTAGGLLGHRKVWDGRWRVADSTLYLRESRRLYSRLYDPRQTAAGNGALAMDLTAEASHWRNKWICHYYYYDIARAEWRTDDEHFVYTAGATPPAAASREQALSAFRAVFFDRYASPADSLTLAEALTRPACLRFSVFSKQGDSTFLEAYRLFDAQGRADCFRLCGRLEKRGPQTPVSQTDTVFLSYQTLDRLQAALSAAADRP